MPGWTSQLEVERLALQAFSQAASCAVCDGGGEQAGGDEHQHEAGDAEEPARLMRTPPR